MSVNFIDDFFASYLMGQLGSHIKRPTPATTFEEQCKKILLADDDEDFHDILDYLFSSPHYHIHHANDAYQAIESFSEVKPDIVLLDVEMPKMSGITLAQNLKQQSLLYKIPLMAITKNKDKTVCENLFTAGVDDLEYKPINTLKLKTKIDYYLFSK